MKRRKLFSSLISLLLVLIMLPAAPVSAEEHVHNYEYEIKVVKPYTCTTAGMEKHICSCGAYKFEQVQPHHTESFKKPYTKDPTCGDPGIADKVCEKCGEVLETDAEVPPTGEHDYVVGTRPATCKDPEKTGEICSVCGQAKGEFTVSGEALGHDWGEWATTPAGCEADGESVRKCKRQGCNEKEVKKLPALGHDMQDTSTVVEANCEHGAGVIRECANGCGKTDVLEFTDPDLAVPALGHNWVTDAAVEATCEGIGYIPYHCDRDGCGATTKDAIVPALGHKMSEKVVKPTCQDGGYTVSECAVCGYVSEKFNETDAEPDAHVLTDDSVVIPATCTKNGLMKLKCSVCNATEFSEEDVDFGDSVDISGITINKTNRYRVIPAGHTWDEGVTTPATCTQDGVTAYTCTVVDCGATKEAVIAKLGHATEEAVIKEANCGEPGEKAIVCTRDCCKDAEGNNLVLEDGIVIPATGEHDYGDVTIEPTCTEEGKVGFACKICGKMDEEWFVYADALGHDYQKVADESTPASCTADGVILEKCSRCDLTRESVDPMIDHEYVDPSETDVTTDEDGNDISSGFLDADCENPAYEVEVCKLCKKIRKTPVLDENGDYMEGFAPTGHTESMGVTVEPTCESHGYTEMSCSVCDATWEAATTEALGHDIVDEVVPANCTDRGYTIHKCSRCDYVKAKDNYTPIDPNTHVIVLTEIKAQTCTVNGVSKKTCEKCGKSLGYQTIPADHKWDNGVTNEAATCVTDGSVEYTCASCDATYAAVIPAKGHTENITASQPATCVEAGWKDVTCSECGKDLGRIEIEPTGEHDYQDDQYIDATCTEPLKIGRLCTVCHKPESEDSYTTIGEPLGHEMSKLDDIVHTKILTPAACEVSGSAVLSCLHDGCKVTQEAVIPALEHNWDLDSSDTDPHPADCEHAAYMVERCSECQATRAAVIDGEDNKPLGHSWVVLEEKAPTCTQDGVTVYECTRPGCDATYEAVATDSALGHDLTTVSVEANCKEDGYTVEKCTRCDYEGAHTDIVPADPDAHVATGGAVIKEANCTTVGVQKLVCAGCGKAMGYKSLPASHDWGTPTVEKAATCTQDGVQVKTCSKCGEEEKEDVKATGHKEKEEVVIANTCGKDGVNRIVCTVCGDVVKDNIVTKATGKHQFNDDDVLDPTCTEPGKVGTICSVCGEVEGDYFEFGEPLGHDWDEEHPEVVSPAACEVSGMAIIHCSRQDCDATKSAVIPALEHDWEYPADGSGYHDADCEHGDYVVATCSKCGAENKEETGINGPLGHSWVTKEAVEASCETGGYVVMECTRDGCEATMSAAETPALGHDWVEKVVPPNCKNEGYTADVCTRCGKEGEHRDIVASGESLHVAVAGPVIKEATCTTGGVRKLVCAGCGKSMGYEAIPAAPHTWGEAKVTKPATCTEPGEQTKTCTVCGKDETESIPANGHDVDMDSADFDDLTTAIWYHCKNCEFVVFDENGFMQGIENYKPFDWITEDHEKNHQIMPVTDEAVAPTETTEGKTEGSHCLICGHIIVPQEIIPPTGPVCEHEYGNPDVVEENGEMVFKYTCTKCGNTYTEPF